jgi:predicted RNA-binding protein YlxR (DUF448 family)
VTAAAVLNDDETAPSGPQRRCLVSGEERPKAALVRFVVGPDGTLVPDVDGRLPGRGLWTLARRDIVADGVARRLFARAARRPLQVDGGLADRVEQLLLRRCVDGLGLARRAGQAVPGFEKVRIAIDKGRCVLLVVAVGAAEDGRRKLGAGTVLPVADALTEAELGAAFGRDTVTYAGVAAGSLAERIAIDAARLAGFRGRGSEINTDNETTSDTR